MNTVRQPVLVLASSPAEPQALAQQGVSEAPRETLLSARAPGRCRIYAMHVRALGAWLKEDVALASPIDVANHLAGPGPERSLSWLLQEWTGIIGVSRR